ncbi:MAG: magnesium and cobalt transport protein CorA, partial [Thermomicrobiales bacterium]|nr:magnesium and cobalt transport protein CorA [Thermomicrobiales bacterium]
MIQVIVHSSPNGPVSETRLENLSELITHEQTTIWIDVVDPTPDEIARIGEEFQFHPLALEDVSRGGQRPKVDQYDNYQFIVFSGLTSQNDHITTHEVDIFLAKHCLVTFHKSDLPVMAQTAERWRTNATALGNHGVGFLLHSVLDALVDGYFPVLDDIAERAETMEESIIL